MLRARTPLQRPPSAAPPPPFPPRGRNSAELRLRGGRAGEGAGGRAGLVVVLPHGACGAAPLPGGRGRSGAAWTAEGSGAGGWVGCREGARDPPPACSCSHPPARREGGAAAAAAASGGGYPAPPLRNGRGRSGGDGAPWWYRRFTPSLPAPHLRGGGSRLSAGRSRLWSER